MTQRNIDEETAAQVTALWEREEVSLAQYATVCTGGDRTEAEDLVVRAFFAATQSWQKLADRGPDAQRAWLRTIVNNMWIDNIRRAGRLQKLRPDLLRLYDRDGQDPADIVMARDVLERCWRVLQALPPVRRQVALLHFYKDASAVNIAERLGISPSGVRKHLAEARKTLREQVGSLRGDEPTPTVGPRGREGETA
ncbi:RNA polymerase sigma factor [Streptomyces sp. NPDC006703]